MTFLGLLLTILWELPFIISLYGAWDLFMHDHNYAGVVFILMAIYFSTVLPTKKP